MKKLFIPFLAVIFAFTAVFSFAPQAEAKKPKSKICKEMTAKYQVEINKIANYDTETNSKLNEILTNPQGLFAGGMQQEWAKYKKQRKDGKKAFIAKATKKAESYEKKMKRYCK